MSGVFMEQEDIIAHYRAESASLREELAREHAAKEAALREAELLLGENLRLKREAHDLRKQVQSWADEADKEIQLAALRRAELEAIEL
jgi:heterodisulfide reductase subunit A-like polyferredoxin